MTSEKNSIFKVRLSRRAENYIKRVDRKMQKRIAIAIETIRRNPLRGPHIKALEASEEDYRYYLGNLRIVYTVNLNEKVINISSIGPRGDIYKK